MTRDDKIWDYSYNITYETRRKREDALELVPKVHLAFMNTIDLKI